MAIYIFKLLSIVFVEARHSAEYHKYHDANVILKLTSYFSIISLVISFLYYINTYFKEQLAKTTKLEKVL